MLTSIFWFWILSFVQEVPNKPSTEYVLKFDLKFKTESSSNTKFEINEATGGFRKPRENVNLPYLVLHLKILKLSSEEVRIRILKGQESYLNKKIIVDDEVRIDIGFIADIKDKIIPNKYNVFFLNADKEVISQVIIFFDEDGYYFVNGEKRGKI